MLNYDNILSPKLLQALPLRYAMLARVEERMALSYKNNWQINLSPDLYAKF